MGFNHLHLPILLISFLLLLQIVFSELAHICSLNNIEGNKTNYQQSLKYLLDNLGTNAPIQDGFKNATWAQDTAHPAYGLALCRGDASLEDCKTCLTNAIIAVANKHCPDSRGAIIWDTLCQVKYADKNFFGQIDKDNNYFMENMISVREDNFTIAAETLLLNLSDSINVTTFFGNGTRVQGQMTLYGMVQCTRDLSVVNCQKCLEDAISDLLYWQNASRGLGARLLYGSCNVRYEMNPFLN